MDNELNDSWNDFNTSWNIVEAVYHDILIIYESPVLADFYELIQQLRVLNYDRYFDADCEAAYLILSSGENTITFDVYEKEGGMRVYTLVDGKERSVYASPVALTLEVQALLENFILSPLDAPDFP